MPPKGHLKIQDDLPIVLYDTTRQQAIAIFRQKKLAARYLFGLRWNNSKSAIVSRAAATNSKIMKSDLGVPIAVRFVNDKYKEMLWDNDVVIIDDSLKKFDEQLLIGFTTNRIALYNKMCKNRLK